MPNQFSDSPFWQGIKASANGAYNSLANFGSALTQPGIDYMMQPAERAGVASREAFPGQPWDGSQRNALRHSLWVGGMAQAMGAGPDNPRWTPFALQAARAAGYAHEGISGTADWLQGTNQDSFHERDRLHDFNNNAVGAAAAAYTRDSEELRRVLVEKAINARRGAPVGAYSMSDGQLSAD